MASDGGDGGSSIGSDFFFFLGIIILFFFIWVAGGGPSRPLSFQGPYLNPITNTGQTAEAYGNGVGTISSGINIGGWGVGVSAGGGGGTPSTSNTAGMVTLLKDSTNAKSGDEEREYVTIMVSPLATSAISTAGWKLVSTKTGNGASFPQGTETPRSGRVNSLSAIQLSPGDTAVVVTGRSPVGLSFKENRCSGYFEERQDFYPSLSQSCPTPYQEYTRVYDEDDEECATFVRSIPYCATDTDIPSNVSNSCEAFVEQVLTYNGCVDAHENESGFRTNTWRIYLGKSDELWRHNSDTILLIDAQGKTIDTLSY